MPEERSGTTVDDSLPGRRGAPFTPEQIAYLSGLEAVDRVDERSIHYTPAFRAACLRRTMAGESPTELFRRAGLDPSIIGWRRIGTVVHHWNQRRAEILAASNATDIPAVDPAAIPAPEADGEEPSDGFTGDQIAYLGTLPAVTGVGPDRIRYAEGFRRACMRRYLDGANPSDLFRKAGLDPELVGAKRIERAFSRWRAKGMDDLDGDDTNDERYFPYGEPMGGPRGGANRWNLLTGRHPDTAPEPTGDTDDREAYGQLVRYNRILERENRIMRRRLGLGPDDPVTDGTGETTKDLTGDGTMSSMTGAEE